MFLCRIINYHITLKIISFQKCLPVHSIQYALPTYSCQLKCNRCPVGVRDFFCSDSNIKHVLPTNYGIKSFWNYSFIFLLMKSELFLFYQSQYYFIYLIVLELYFPITDFILQIFWCLSIIIPVLQFNNYGEEIIHSQLIDKWYLKIYIKTF